MQIEIPEGNFLVNLKEIVTGAEKETGAEAGKGKETKEMAGGTGDEMPIAIPEELPMTEEILLLKIEKIAEMF